MTFTLMKNISEREALTKSLTTLETLTGSLRNQSSIIDPVIEVTGIASSTVTSCNYAYIPEFGRYYFVKNITSVRNNVWVIQCHVDVLKTYATQIKAQTAVVRRQEKNWNLYLDDGIFKTYQNPQIITKAFPAGFTTQNFVLAVAGGN
jgi:hypothetical protein